MHTMIVQSLITFPTTKERIDLKLDIRPSTPNAQHINELATDDSEGGKYGRLANFDIAEK